MSQYLWDDILIVGDSFCADRSDPHDWPHILTTKLTKFPYTRNLTDPRGKGFCGSSWWSVRKCLLKEIKIKPAKIIIICHTDPYRLPNDYDYPLNYGTMAEYSTKSHPTLDETIVSAAISYFENLKSDDFHLWAMKQWFNELDTILKENSYDKCLHLFCFPNYFYNFKCGVSIRDDLIQYRSKKELSNHFDLEKNYRLAEKLFRILEKYPGDFTQFDERLL